MDQFIGAIFSYGFNFNPIGNMKCWGQSLAISEYDALFALIGTTYGGDGQSTFNLPDLRGRVPLHMGTGQGLPTYDIGQVGGAENVTLTNANMPVHTHALLSAKLPVAAGTGTIGDPTNNYYAGADTNIGTPYRNSGNAPMGSINPVNSDIAGSGIPVDIMSPYLVINYSIAVTGIFPSRN